jgi:two-component system response regulator FlrC
MIAIDENNKELALELQTAFTSRGMEAVLFSSENQAHPSSGEKIYVSPVEANFDFNENKELIPFLKKYGFKKAFYIAWGSDDLLVEKFLNGGITIVRIPEAYGSGDVQRLFYLHYFIDHVLVNLPNLPCSDVESASLISLIKKIASTDATVLVNGPTGTGKEVVSNLIHHFSDRGENAFVAVNCAAIPDQMLESMLFGHEKGAFTGAVQPNKGLLRAADKGTVLLDEISEMPLALQAKLLRVIQEKKVMPIGSSQEVSVDVRIVATTNRNMLEEVKSGNFREDLYYRLNVFPLNTLSLSKRQGDVPAIVANILFNMDIQTEFKTKISKEALNKLQAYTWPGNVRELYNVIQRAKILCSDREILISDLIFDSEITDHQINTAEVLASKFNNKFSDEVVL